MFNKLLDFFCYHKIKNIYEGKMKMEKNRKIWNKMVIIWCKCQEKIIFYCYNIWPKGLQICSSTSKLIGIFSCPSGHHGAKQSWIKILYFYLALMNLSAKPLELISMVAPIGLFTLSSILTLTCIKWALETWKSFPKRYIPSSLEDEDGLHLIQQ